MDSSNAEKAWEEHRGNWPMTSSRESFDAGVASRDAEVAELTRLLAESRARFGDSEARRAALEAVVRAATDYLADQRLVRAVEILDSAPSVVLEDRDRENRAIGWDEGWDRGVEYERWGESVSTANPYRGDKK